MKVTKKHFYRSSRGKKIILSTLISIALVFVAIAVGVNIWYKNNLKPLKTDGSAVIFVVDEGQSAPKTATSLQEQSLIRSSQAFLWYLRNQGITNKIQAGSYEITPTQSSQEIAQMLTTGKVSSKFFTILPGKRLDQIRQNFIDAGFSAESVDKALDPANYSNHPALIAKPTDQSLEGYIYPETFKIDASTTPQQIVRLSLDELASVLTPGLIDAFQAQGLGIHRAITLASIIEKEAANNQDKKDIAGVFYNRLKQGMPLQSDPTYKYAAFLKNEAPSPAIDSPYNTYKVNGLPPGPISNVSKNALQAVASPTKSDYLYFVSGDDNITRFSKTLQEHEALVKQYCIKKCATY
jgi:UPF0755 protein